jgi:two-component system, chemotaxis family, chemotaxis protein CheY
VRGRVLVVEDDETIRHLVSMALFDEGYEVLAAANGAVALERMREHPPDVILLDMNMPIMDGWEFARRYRELNEAPANDYAPAMSVRRAPAVIVMTAGMTAQSRAEQIGAEDYLAKPFDLEMLMETVERHLPTAPAGRGAR